MHRVQTAIDLLVKRLKDDQGPDGTWHYPFETGTTTDCYMIILLRSLEINDEQLIQGLVNRILRKQQDHGGWQLFYDDKEGSLDRTIEAYYALLYSGYVSETDECMRLAKQFIIRNGGLEKANMMTKAMLALTGQYHWHETAQLPVELLLLPVSFPINFYDFSIYARSNLVPLLILADTKYVIRTKRSPDLSELKLSRRNENYFGEGRLFEWEQLLNKMQQWLETLEELPKELHERALKRGEQYMIERIEPDGTFYSYFSATFYMIFALLARGYEKEDPVIQKAIKGLSSMQCVIDDLPHMQFTTATVWNTALVSDALQLSGIDYTDEMIQRANHYLLSKQHQLYGDWIIHNSITLAGGWGFSDSNTINPDVDDSTAALRSLRQLVKNNPVYRQAWDRGLNWTISMQNKDGGWPAFERNIDKEIITLLSFPEAKHFLLDPSSSDLTGRTLEYLGNYTNMIKDHPRIKKAVKWLVNNQEDDGSWYGRWGICYIYGTWAALIGLGAVGIRGNHSSVQKAVKWLEQIQNDDGGWGESCKSDHRKRYVPLSESTLTHTAWAVDGLMAVYQRKTSEIEKGISYLVDNIEKDDWTVDYPTGQGLPGQFYIHYHSYRYVWPLVTLSRFQNKFLLN